ncbi:MAG TPA: MBL fold metallo-hydrolase [Vicinamibacterales bacterium]|jgi:competence protein ComEC|nr:MBL fold metallo-hydrolase [Vicinamibacterales bacterium]
MKRRLGIAMAAALLAAAVHAIAAGKTLDIYFIDVEGGQSTLVVTPSGESLLIDAGYAGFDGRDPGRVVAAARTAGVTRIDYLLITHFHGDHAGGVPELAKRLPIRTFVDHDDVVAGDASAAPVLAAYAAVRAAGRHLVAKPGDHLPLKGVDVEVVSSAARTISEPVPGGGQPNPACEASARAPGEPLENPRSTGVYLRFGTFRFLDLGDLSGAPLFALFCPRNLLGQIDLYLVPHHGGSDVVYPATFATRPRVAIMNNGEQKGGSPESFAALRASRGIADVWQLHMSRAKGAQNFAAARVANLDETTAHWVKVSASEDGSFTVTNGRTGETKKY